MRVNPKYKEVAKAFFNELPLEYIHYIINNKNYVIPVEKNPPKVKAGWGLSSERITYIENKAIECRNRYHTEMIRIELNKLLNEALK